MSLREIIQVTWLSLLVSGSAVLLAMAAGLPAAVLLYLKKFPGRRLITALVNTGMGLPPVVVGLLVAVLFWRTGPLGFLGMMYTPVAMVIAQFIIALPLVVGLSLAAFEQVDPEVLLQARALGASGLQTVRVLFRESSLGQLAAIMAAFGGVISEVGAVMMVGGNLKGYTRVLTTAIVQETRTGNLRSAVYLALILLALSFLINLFLTSLQRKGASRWQGPSWK
ncbi:MAG: ABC transporter permease [Candidatus Saccharicenans sp.]|jgi:tungstate transport system permease protein|nr:ABC transporter permease [Candidatus Saccharicenans sp.]MDH7575083.1 ABC transporter permease [Candidatus Saccharicenans sp.]